jgi:uncharacterized protein
MPLPTPGPEQDHEAFIAACMAKDVMITEFPDSAQRRAVCQKQWDEARHARTTIETRGEERAKPGTSGDVGVEARGVSRVLRGYAVVFDRLSEVLHLRDSRDNLEEYREQIAPSAIDRTLSERTDLIALLNHDPSKPLGRLTAGTLRVAKNTHGLLVEIDPPENDVHGIVESIRRRDVRSMSFGFQTVHDVWNYNTTPPTRTVTDMLVREVSIVTFPAYIDTSIALRSFYQHRPALPGRTVTDRLADYAKRKY